MKAALISLGSVSSKWIAKAMKKYFEKVDFLNIKNIEVNSSSSNPEVMYNGKPLDEYFCIYARGSFRYAQLLRAVTESLKDRSYMPCKPATFTIGHDKLLTQLSANKKEVPMPKTYLASTAEAGKKILEKINYPIVMKFPSGTHGKGVMFADSYESASSMLDALDALNQSILIQEYVETNGKDIRAIVVGDKVVAAMERQSGVGDKRANIHSGGKGVPKVLDAHTKKIAVAAAESVGAEICAVDIIEGPTGPLVLEVNLSPGLQGITEVTKIDVADKIAKYLYKVTKEIKEGKKIETTTEIFKDLGIDESEKNDIITNLDFRGERILLPNVVTNITKFGEKDEIVIKAEKGKLVIEEFKVGKEKKK